MTVRSLALVSALALAASFASPPTRAADPKDERPFPAATRAALDAALDRSFAATKAPGVVVGVWIAGEGAYVATRGYADLARKRPMSAQDHFRIGSNSKTFTASLLLILADEGRLGLDDPVAKYAPWVPDGASITLRMLANMTAGLASYTEDDKWVDRAFADTKRSWTPRELVDVGIAQKPTNAPGRGWHYSNTDYVLLGMIMEQVTGASIPALLKHKILVPLRLRHTSFPTTSAMPAPYARGITVQTLDGKQADATFRNPTWAFTAGQMVSTLADLRAWVDAYTSGALLSPAMQKARLDWVTLPPNTPEKHYGLGIGETNGWLGHTGELPGYNTAGYRLPSRNATVVVMVNSDIAAGGDNPAPLILKSLIGVIAPDRVPK